MISILRQQDGAPITLMIPALQRLLKKAKLGTVEYTNIVDYNVNLVSMKRLNTI